MGICESNVHTNKKRLKSNKYILSDTYDSKCNFIIIYI